MLQLAAGLNEFSNPHKARKSCGVVSKVKQENEAQDSERKTLRGVKIEKLNVAMGMMFRVVVC